MYSTPRICIGINLRNFTPHIAIITVAIIANFQLLHTERWRPSLQNYHSELCREVDWIFSYDILADPLPRLRSWIPLGGFRPDPTFTNIYAPGDSSAIHWTEICSWTFTEHETGSSPVHQQCRSSTWNDQSTVNDNLFTRWRRLSLQCLQKRS